MSTQLTLGSLPASAMDMPCAFPATGQQKTEHRSLTTIRKDFQNHLRVIAQDVDVMSAQMCYIQLSLIGCQARVIVGNTLALECRDVYVTPFAAMKGWFN